MQPLAARKPDLGHKRGGTLAAREHCVSPTVPPDEVDSNSGAMNVRCSPEARTSTKIGATRASPFEEAGIEVPEPVGGTGPGSSTSASCEHRRPSAQRCTKIRAPTADFADFSACFRAALAPPSVGDLLELNPPSPKRSRTPTVPKASLRTRAAMRASAPMGAPMRQARSRTTTTASATAAWLKLWTGRAGTCPCATPKLHGTDPGGNPCTPARHRLFRTSMRSSHPAAHSTRKRQASCNADARRGTMWALRGRLRATGVSAPRRDRADAACYQGSLGSGH